MKNLAAATGFLKESPTGRALLGFADRHGVTFSTDPLLEPEEGCYYASSRRIDLGYQPAPAGVEKTTARELLGLTSALRRAFHNLSGLPLEGFAPLPYLRFRRVISADISAVNHLVAWEMRAAGAGFFWRHLIAADSVLTDAFSVVAETAPPDFLKEASREVFLEWFGCPERVFAADEGALLALSMPASPVRNSSLPDPAVFGVLPQGGNYLENTYLPSAAYLPPVDSGQARRLAILSQPGLEYIEI